MHPHAGSSANRRQLQALNGQIVDERRWETSLASKDTGDGDPQWTPTPADTPG